MENRPFQVDGAEERIMYRRLPSFSCRALAVWIRVRENITAPDVVSDEELFRRGAGTLSQDLDRYFERLPLLVQRRYLQFDPCDRGD
jgi:hypothetical protein